MTASPRSPSAAAEPPPRTATRNRGASQGHLCPGWEGPRPRPAKASATRGCLRGRQARDRPRRRNKGSAAPAAGSPSWGSRAPRCQSPVAAARDEDGKPRSRSGRQGSGHAAAARRGEEGALVQWARRGGEGAGGELGAAAGGRGEEGAAIGGEGACRSGCGRHGGGVAGEGARRAATARGRGMGLAEEKGGPPGLRQAMRSGAEGGGGDAGMRPGRGRGG